MKRAAPLPLVLLVAIGCDAPAPAAAVPTPPPAASPRAKAPAPPRRPELPPERLTCASDEGCRFDPVTEQCGNDPHYNRQPDMVDQGVICHCDGGRCGTLRVWPVPCESDDSCAVALAPRPHPVAASARAPRLPRTACAFGATYSVTCERTNICTLHRHACP
ncbi:MAG TPA: hypothetical protein VHB21_14400 [Minicystis sp.]|nr:hypothetical protein [Minicystis sp.]